MDFKVGYDPIGPIVDVGYEGGAAYPSARIELGKISIWNRSGRFHVRLFSGSEPYPPAWQKHLGGACNPIDPDWVDVIRELHLAVLIRRRPNEPGDEKESEQAGKRYDDCLLGHMIIAN